MTPFNWDHPAISISHGPRSRNVSLKVPSFVRPKSTYWTPDRMGIAALIWGISFAFLLGVALGAR